MGLIDPLQSFSPDKCNNHGIILKIEFKIITYVSLQYFKMFFLLTSQDIIAIQNVQDYVNGKLNRLQVMWIPLEKC